jgi:hypothetical protein
VSGNSEGSGWERVETGDEPDFSLPAGNPPEASVDEYRPLVRRASLARASLVLIALASVVAVVFDVVDRSLFARAGGGGTITIGELEASDDRALAIATAQGAFGILAAIFFIAWLHRAYKNLRALGVQDLRYGTGWAIGSWFVPILNLFRPVQIANDVWRGSEPRLQDSRGWRDEPVPALFGWWWATWLLSGSIGGVAGRILFGAQDTDDYELSSALYIAVDGLTVIAALLAILVVDRTTARQGAAIAAARGEEPSDIGSRAWLRGRRSAAAAVAACAAAAGLGALVVAVQPTGSAIAAGGGDVVARPASVAPENFSFADDFSDPASGWIQDEDASADFVYERDQYRMTVKRAEETWFSFLDFGARMSDMVVEAKAVLQGPRADDDAIGVGCFFSQEKGYIVSLWPDGYYVFGYSPNAVADIELLADGTVPTAVDRIDRPVRLGIECTGGQPATLALLIDGDRAAETRHDAGLPSFQIASLAVTAGTDAATVIFDDVEVRRLD